MVLVELARYRLREGASETALLEAEEAIQRTVGPSHPGYIDRVLLKGTDGSYILIMRWENQEAAGSWNSTLFASQPGQKLGSLVDASSMSMERLTSLVPS